MPPSSPSLLPHNGSLIRSEIENRTRAEGIDLTNDYVHVLDSAHCRGLAHYFVHHQAWGVYVGASLASHQAFAISSFAVLDDGEVLKSRSTRIVVGENVLRGRSGVHVSVKLLPMSVSQVGAAEAKERHLCHCPLRELLMYGCRCGGR